MTIIKCLLFAKVKEVINKGEYIEIELPDTECTTNNLLKHINEQYPQVKDVLSTCLLAINLEFLKRDEDRVIQSTDEVAIIPPVSGG
ncbi:hypothetical protein CYY_004712 [Polysphondylium violaceum]|uniref:Molybdopterin synthase sulfur carrier subunit n=1 Tax=Polysphondylium violaceum TaxID=133409 RepID=A0A8J4V4V9_9MYCE|nr:hypothetical protein CYY_004712 [Polysphondylium violaceum]